MTPEKFAKIMQGAFQVYVETNAHRTAGQTVAEYLRECIYCEAVDEEAAAGDLADLPQGWEAWETLCELQVYPRTQVGFWVVYGATLNQCLDQVGEADILEIERARKLPHGETEADARIDRVMGAARRVNDKRAPIERKR